MSKSEAIDAREVGLKAGLEIHQQLDTHKLFCNCPSLLRSDEPVKTVTRVLNPVAGETGVVDPAAAFEKLKNKTFTYQFFDTNCLVELDEEPPHTINSEALRIGLQIALLLNCKIFPVSQIMRKTVIDGSNTSGFQRTVLIAHDGYIETSLGKVRVETIALEEDSARKVQDSSDKRTYSLDRLGIPLVEITTKPDLKTPEHIKEAALKIGEILRACQVRRGIGTIRQDVNVSTKGTNRVEIKGFQDAKMMTTVVENEIHRQQTLLSIKDKFKGVTTSDVEDLTEMFTDTNAPMIKQKLQKAEKIFGFSLSGLSGVIGTETQVGKRVGSDFSDYAKPVSGIGGIIHSDENLEEKYGMTKEEVSVLQKKLLKHKSDAFILIIGSFHQATLVKAAIVERMSYLKSGNPKEVRQAQVDGTTKFLRPMPGAARMYPETDCELLRIKKQQVDELKKDLPKLASEHKTFLKEFGLNEELMKLLLKQEKVEDFKELTTVTDHYDTIAKSLTLFKAEIAKKEGKSSEEIDEVLNLDVMAEILGKVGKELTPNDVKQTLHKVVQGKSVSEALEKQEVHLSEEIKKLMKEKPGLSQGAYMGLIMGKFKGHVTGKEVMDELAKQMG